MLKGGTWQGNPGENTVAWKVNGAGAGSVSYFAVEDSAGTGAYATMPTTRIGPFPTSQSRLLVDEAVITGPQPSDSTTVVRNLEYWLKPCVTAQTRLAVTRVGNYEQFTVTTKPTLAGARVRMYRLGGGHAVLIASAKTSKRGIARFTVRRTHARTAYRARVAATTNSLTSTSSKVVAP